MSIEQICDYLNEIGILDINNIKNYLMIATNIVNNNTSNKSIKEIYIISLFAYLKGINNNDKNLYFLCNNIINSYSRYSLIKKYDFLCNLKRILYYKILQKFKHFMSSLYRVFPFKNYKSNKNYYKNKKKKIQNNTCSNAFYNKKNNFQNFTENNMIKEKHFPEQKNKINTNDIFLPNKSPENKSNKNINNTNSNSSPIKLEIDNFQITNKRIYKEVPRSKKSSSINIDMCIAQSNINFEKYFINKRNIICKKCRPSYIDIIINNKKELYSQKKNFLRKNKSETKLRTKKLDYEDKTRSQNLAKIKPELKRKLEKSAKSKREKEYYDKQKEEELFNKLTEKTIDEKNFTDRFYRKYIIKKKEDERKQKMEENSKIKKSPIIWEQVYLQTNEKIIKKNNQHKKNKTCSYFMPHRGRVYKYEENEKIKDTKDEKENKNEKNIKEINNKNPKNKENKENKEKQNEPVLQSNFEKEKEKEINTKEDNPFINNYLYEIKESDLTGSINSKKDSKSLKNDENKENIINNKINDNEEELKKISTNSLFASVDNGDKIKEKEDNFNISPGGFKSKQLQELLKKNIKSNPLDDFKKINIDNLTKDSNIFSIESDNDKTSLNKVSENGNENKEEMPNIRDKMKFNDLLCSEKIEE